MNYSLIILGMAIVTFGTRYLVLVYFSKIEMPHSIKSALNFVPPVILTAIIVPSLMLDNGQYNLTNSNTPLIAGAITTFIAIKTKNLLLTITLGMISFWGIQYLTNVIF